MSRPVVLHVLEALEGGTARHVVDLVRHAGGVEHHVAVPRVRVGGVTDRAAADQVRAAGGVVHDVDMRRLPVHPRNAVAVARLAVLARRTRADVLHGHSSVGGALARALPVRAARVYTPNGLHPAPAAARVERLLGRRTDRLVAVSASEGALAQRLGLVDPARLVVVPNGVDLDPPAPVDLHARAGLAPGTPLVGTVARLSHQKAPEDFVAVAARVLRARPDVAVVLVGDGPLAPQVDAQAAALGPRFVRLPELPGAAAALGSLDVFCLLSRFEGGPYAPLEAARAGVPLVLTDVVGSTDVAVDGVSGRVVAQGDVEGAARAVLDLLADPALARRTADAMRDRLAAHFDVRAQGARHTALYRELSGGPP